jgi:hypothetical protein
MSTVKAFMELQCFDCFTHEPRLAGGTEWLEAEDVVDIPTEAWEAYVDATLAYHEARDRVVQEIGKVACRREDVHDILNLIHEYPPRYPHSEQTLLAVLAVGGRRDS